MILDKGYFCCGCNVCGSICPTEAIYENVSPKGFWSVGVDKSKCIECGKCDKVCPMSNRNGLQKEEFDTFNRIIYAVKSERYSVRINSRSGGGVCSIGRILFAK